MAEKKGWGEKLVGLFVVREGEEGEEGHPREAASAPGSDDADALIAKYAADSPASAATPGAAPRPAAGSPAGATAATISPNAAASVQALSSIALPGDAADVDFPAVYRAAGIIDEAQGHVDKAMNLLKALPATTPRDVKRSIVEASLKAFGVSIASIVEAGQSELGAIDAFVAIGQKDLERLLGEATTRIQALEQEIADLKALMEQKMTGQHNLTVRCGEQKQRVTEVLDFFGGVPGGPAPAR